MSRAVVATAFGGPEVLSVVEKPVAEPGRGQVRIAVRAAGVNPIDYKSYSGAFGADASELPKPVGSEVSGVVDAVGPEVTEFEVGDEVIGYGPPGAYADHYLTVAESVVAKPPDMTWEEAAGLLLTGRTAVHTLV